MSEAILKLCREIASTGKERRSRNDNGQGFATLGKPWVGVECFIARGPKRNVHTEIQGERKDFPSPLPYFSNLKLSLL
jgi:hypothetical protein